MRRPDENRAGGARRDRFQIPVMFAFREAAAAGDSTRRDETFVDGERVLSARGTLRRRGANEARLRTDLAIDLGNLTNTINLASTVDIQDLAYLSRSVLNYGLDDLSHMTSDDLRIKAIGASLKRALECHEPRLIAGSIYITQADGGGADDFTLKFHVAAEMACDPIDLPLSFVAELDLGSGKVSLNGLGGA